MSECAHCHQATDGDSSLCGPCAVELARKIIDSAASTFHACKICGASYSTTEARFQVGLHLRPLCWICNRLFHSAKQTEPTETPSIYF